MRLTAAFVILSTALVSAQNCPQIHVFGARETTVPPGMGTAGQLVNQILQAFPGATSEAISYPACGGQPNCGGASYADSAKQGTAAVGRQVNAFHQRCPQTKLVLVGYSQVHPTLRLDLLGESHSDTFRTRADKS